MAGTLAFFLQDFASTFPPLYAPEELMAKVVMRAFMLEQQETFYFFFLKKFFMSVLLEGFDWILPIFHKS